HRLGRNVFCAFEIAHDQELVLLCAGCERKSAITHHHGSHSVPARAGTEGIPEYLRVHVGMTIDKAWRDDMAFGVDDFICPTSDLTDRSDAAVGDTNVSLIVRKTRAIDHRSAANDDIVLHAFLLSREASAFPPNARCVSD